MAVKLKVQGNFNRSYKYLDKLRNLKLDRILNKYGQMGVEVLSASTPIDTGNTAGSWSYEISITGSGFSVSWNNSHANKGVNIAIILQYGHGTGTGGYVQGRDYINPALQPVFDKMAEEAWSEVRRV